MNSREILDELLKEVSGGKKDGSFSSKYSKGQTISLYDSSMGYYSYLYIEDIDETKTEPYYVKITLVYDNGGSVFSHEWMDEYSIDFYVNRHTLIS
ncbi:MAG: hypothetical protein Q4E33_05325 [Erysipelotrichaceae bacterium]|nr:hypothetical protein [Erysipelotrichaceae bacterium]